MGQNSVISLPTLAFSSSSWVFFILAEPSLIMLSGLFQTCVIKEIQKKEVLEMLKAIYYLDCLKNSLVMKQTMKLLSDICKSNICSIASLFN